MLDNLTMTDAVRAVHGLTVLILSLLTLSSPGWIWILLIVGVLIMQSPYTGFSITEIVLGRLGLFKDK